MPVSGGRAFQAERMVKIKIGVFGHHRTTQGDGGIHHTLGNGTMRVTTVDPVTGTMSCYYIMVANDSDL